MLSSSNILVMRNAILKASKNLRRDFGELEKLQNSKSNIKNFVENSYQNTQDALLADLKGARPDWVFYIKKNDNFGLQQLKDEKFCLIKPISGLSNFAKGISYFAISAIYFNKLIPEAAVIYDPIKDELFYSEKGRGAFVNNSRIRFSSLKKLPDSIFVLNNNTLFMPMIQKKILNITQLEVRIFGCSCLDIANLASGKIDCYITNSKLEDSLEPGTLLVQEAGGIEYSTKADEKIFFYTNDFIVDILENKL